MSRYMRSPQSRKEWENIAREYEEKWNFPNFLGALDGKHVCIECPKNAGSAYYNYKNFHSMVLLARCDAKYCFTLVDGGSFGRDNDTAILSESVFGKMFASGPEAFDVPEPRTVENYNLKYVLVGDEIFPLKPWLMKPFPGRGLNDFQRIYNYRLSRARWTTENVFGILSVRWRVFRTPIKATVATVEDIIKATTCLHNYLQLTYNASYTPSGFVDCDSSDGEVVLGDWRADVTPAGDGALNNLGQVGSNRYSCEAALARNNFKDYLNNEGAVKWQQRHVSSCGVINTA